MSTSEFVLLSDRKSNCDVVQFQFTQRLLKETFENVQDLGFLWYAVLGGFFEEGVEAVGVWYLTVLDFKYKSRIQ